MQIITDTANEEVPTVSLVVLDACTSDSTSHIVDNFVLVFRGEQVSDVTT